MINTHVLMEQAKIHNLPANTIEKDYVLSWILAGIAESDKLKNHWHHCLMMADGPNVEP